MAKLNHSNNHIERAFISDDIVELSINSDKLKMGVQCWKFCCVFFSPYFDNMFMRFLQMNPQKLQF